MKRLVITFVLATAPAAAQAQRYQAPANLFACEMVQDVDYFFKLLGQGNDSTTAIYMQQKIETRTSRGRACVTLPKESALVVMDKTEFNGKPYECVRYESQPECVWTGPYSLLSKAR